MKAIIQRLNAACAKDIGIICPEAELGQHPGSPEEYLLSLGLTRGDLKKLEIWGFAIRGRTKNIYLKGEKLPNNKIVQEGERFHAKGSRLRWIIVAREGLTDAKKQNQD